MKFSVCVLIVSLFASAGALEAQTTTGALTGTVTDTQELPLPGVTVTVTGEALMGAQTAATNERGAYRFPALPAGLYTVALDLAGFQSIRREGVIVSVRQTTTIDTQLQLATVQESVTVSGATPVIDVEASKTGVTYTKELLANVPNARDFYVLLEEAPGVVLNKQNIGSAESGEFSRTSNRGTTSAYNQNFSGVNTRDPLGAGGLNYVDYDSFEEVQVENGGYPAEVGGGGMNINMVPKSGGNRFSGGASVYLEDDALQSDNLTDALRAQGISRGSPLTRVLDTGGQLGGPAVQDRVWFFGSGRYFDIEKLVLGFPELYATTLENYLARVTSRVANSHNVSALWTRNVKVVPFRTADRFRAPEATYIQDSVLDVYQGLWTYIIGQDALIETGASYMDMWFPSELQPNATVPMTDLVTRYNWGAYDQNVLRWHNRAQFRSVLTLHRPGIIGADHEFKFGFEHYQGWGKHETTTGRGQNADARFVFVNGAPGQVWLYNTPIVEKWSMANYSGFAQDSLKFGRATVNAGVRWELNQGHLPAQDSPAGRWFSARTLPERKNVVKWLMGEPRLGVVYKLTADSRTILKANYGIYHTLLETTVYQAANANSLGYEVHNWFGDLNGNDLLDAAEFAPAVLRASGGRLTTVDPDLQQPYAQEFILGVQRELAADLSLGVNYIEKRTTGFVEDVNVGVPYTAYTPVPFADPGLDGRLGTRDDATITVFNQHPSTLGQDRYYLTNPEGADSRYRGVEIVGSKRMSRRWQLLGSLSVSRFTGRTDNNGTTTLFNTPNADINSDGRQWSDVPVFLKLAGTYVFPFNIVGSAHFKQLSGLPYTRELTVRGLNQGAITINAGPKGGERAPTTRLLDLRVEKQFALSRDRKLGVMLDVFNATNAATVQTLGTSTGGNYGQPLTILPPRIARLGVRFTF